MTAEMIRCGRPNSILGAEGRTQFDTANFGNHPVMVGILVDFGFWILDWGVPEF